MSLLLFVVIIVMIVIIVTIVIIVNIVVIVIDPTSILGEEVMLEQPSAINLRVTGLSQPESPKP